MENLFAAGPPRHRLSTQSRRPDVCRLAVLLVFAILFVLNLSNCSTPFLGKAEIFLENLYSSRRYFL